MWSSAPLMQIRIKLRGQRHRFGFWLPVSLFALPRLLIACDPLFGIFGGLLKDVHVILDGALSLSLGIMALPPQKYVHVDARDKKEAVYVDIRTLGWSFGKPAAYAPTRQTATQNPAAYALPLLLVSCALCLALSAIIFPGSISLPGVLWGSLWLTLFFTLLRPLLLVLLLPLDLLLGGLCAPFGDALFFLWAAAWSPGLTLSYWQCVALALYMSLVRLPYAYRRCRAALPFSYMR